MSPAKSYDNELLRLQLERDLHAEIDKRVDKARSQALKAAAIYTGAATLSLALLGIGSWKSIPARVETAVRAYVDDTAIGSMESEARRRAAQIDDQLDRANDGRQKIDSIFASLASSARADRFHADLARTLAADPWFRQLAQGPQGPPGPSPVFRNIEFGDGTVGVRRWGRTTGLLETGTAGGIIRLWNRNGDALGYLGPVNRDGTFLGGGLILRDSSGNSTVTISGSGTVTLNGRNGRRAAYLGQIHTAGRSTSVGLLTLSDTTGNETVRIDGSGAIVIRNQRLHDIAELFEVDRRARITPGSIVRWNPRTQSIEPTAARLDRTAIGIISGAGGLESGLILGSRADQSDDLPVAIAGQVFVRVNRESGDIVPGDLIVPSGTPGVGMRAPPGEVVVGAVVAKAIEGFDGEAGEESLVRAVVTTW